MDSGNSGSMQSSSDGDEEYESSHCGAGAESLPYLFPQHQQTYPHAGHMTLGPFSAAPPPPQPPYFDQLAGYFDPVSRSPSATLHNQTQNQNPLLNPDTGWSKPVTRSDQNPSNCTEINPLMAPSTYSNNVTLQPPAHISRGSSSSSTSDQINQNNGGGAGGARAPAPGRNPRKRLRASRRAPTTVLTTDTSNFRAMVQEFTGIPAPPFGSSASSSSLLFPRTRFDLFGSASAASRASSSPLLPAPQLPPYLLRPFAQRIQTPQPITLPLTTTITTTTSAATIPTSNADVSYQLPLPDLGLLNNIPINLSFPSTLPSVSSGSVPGITGSKPAPDGSMELPVNQLSSGHGKLVGLTGSMLATTSSADMGLRLAADESARSGHGENDSHQVLQRLVGNGSASKGNGSATAVRCEGMLESWICSSTD